VDLVAVDMPLSKEPITARRMSDDLVSRAYGARHCSTHTPSVTRPGAISDDLTTAFSEMGYPLATSGQPEHALIEVYPHPALVELACADRRLPYKASKVGTYWPGLASTERKALLFAEWGRIIELLDKEVCGVASALPPPEAGASQVGLKAMEDQIDAIVCAWVGTQVLKGAADPFGDNTSAIWIPRARPLAEMGRKL
jgi:predicted RNase H-like nuclease